MDWKLYPNFTEEEFRCSHTGKCEMHPEFMATLQSIRNAYGKPMIPTSGYRDATHPIEAKKERPGEHSYGCATDIRVRGLSDVMELMKIAADHGISRIGLSQHKSKGYFIHIGMGDRLVSHKLFPPNAIWTY